MQSRYRDGRITKTLLHGNEFQIWQGATGTRTQYALLDKCNNSSLSLEVQILLHQVLHYKGSVKVLEVHQQSQTGWAGHAMHEDPSPTATGSTLRRVTPANTSLRSRISP